MSHQHRSSATTTSFPKLITCVYNTNVGPFALSWSRSLLGHSLRLHHHHHGGASCHLHIKSFPWYYYNYNKKGSKKLNLINIHKPATIFWDLSDAKYGSRSGPEPLSGFYVAIVLDGEIILLVGNSPNNKEACLFRKFQAPPNSDMMMNNNNMILRREHIVCGTKLLYSTKANIGGHERSLSIELCGSADEEDPRLYFGVDNKRVLQIKHLKWKFRGNESIEIDGAYVQISWDVYKWLFDGKKQHHQHQHQHQHQEDGGYALFMFTIFNRNTLNYRNIINRSSSTNSSPMLDLWPHHQQHLFGLGFEENKMKKKKGSAAGNLLPLMRRRRRRSGRSSSSSSLSSANSWGSCSTSVMEWAEEEDSEFTTLPCYSGFSLLVYAWKKS